MILMMYLFKGFFSIVFLIILNQLNPGEISLNIIEVLISLNLLINDVLK